MRRVDPIPCLDCPLQCRPGLRPHTEQELAFIQQYKSGEIALARGELLVRQGEAGRLLFTVLGGMLMRYRLLEDGRRQIVNFMFPGDLVGLQGSFDEQHTHSVEALLDARLCEFTRADFFGLVTRHPELSYDIVWLAAKEETALEEHLVAVGQRSARERLAYLAVWLFDRANRTGLVEPGNVISLPIRQSQIADMLGLSLVHTNRTIKSLARDGLIEWLPGKICVPDLERAIEFAHYPTPGQRRERPFI